MLLKKRSLATALLLALTACSFSLAAKPNIILCMADDQGWGDTAYNGHSYLVTPHLDDMAKSGLRFDRFYAAHPVCTPTRASVMTGRTPNRMGAFKWGHTIRPQEVTVAEALKTAGYATGHFGKWHIGSVRTGSPVNPSNSGFDHWLSAPNFYDNDPILSLNGKAVQMKGESSIVAADAAIEFIKKQTKADKPFLAVVWFGSPHSPHRAVKEDLVHYAAAGKSNHWAAEITGLDRAVGKLRQSLRDLDIHENTLFWYCSDNGGLKTESSGGRAKKGSIYEGGLRVPGIIEWPAVIKKPRVTSLPSATYDIYPTLLEIVGVKMDNQPPLDGVSLKTLIDGDKMKPRPLGFWDHPTGGIGTPSAKWMAELLAAQKAGDPVGDKSKLRMDAGKIKQQYPEDKFAGHAAWNDWPWKLHHIAGKGGKEKVELYNLEKDPMEKKNVADKNADRTTKMQSELNTWLAAVTRSLNGKDYK